MDIVPHLLRWTTTPAPIDPNFTYRTAPPCAPSLVRCITATDFLIDRDDGQKHSFVLPLFSTLLGVPILLFMD